MPAGSGGSKGAVTWSLADPWPLNPQGEILLGLKVEDRHALINGRGEHPGAGRGIRRVGPQRHGDFVAGHETPGGGTLPADARRPATGLCGLQVSRGRLPQRSASGYGDRHDRRGGHDRVRRAGSRREGPQAHQAEDALVIRGGASFLAPSCERWVDSKFGGWTSRCLSWERGRTYCSFWGII